MKAVKNSDKNSSSICFELLHKIFENTVDSNPQNIALIYAQQQISYQELEKRANQLAHYLHAQGIVKGNYVGIYLSHSIDVYIAILAVLKTGAAYIPLDPEFPLERITYSLQNAGARAVITDSQHIPASIKFICRTFFIDQLQRSIHVQPETRLTNINIIADNNAYAIYTSGSTGKPKGVAVTHSSVCHYIYTALNIYHVNSSDKIYQGFSIAFDASIEEIWIAFATGAALVVPHAKEVRSGAGLAEFLTENKVTIFSGVPTLLSILENKLPYLKLLILGGEKCPPALIERWQRPGLRIINTYGPTETTVIATFAECHAGKEITIGRPLPGYEILILDEDLKPVKEGKTGEICIGGAGLARGYINLPVLTAEKFIPHPQDSSRRLYRTGDLGYYTKNGEIQFAGRMDDQVKLRGFRIELNEIEAVLLQCNGVRNAIVGVYELSPEVPALVAYIVPEKNNDVDEKKLKEFLHARVPEYMVPTAFEILDTLPVLASGKVDRKHLPPPSAHLTTSAKNFMAAHTAIEKKLAHVWEEIFNCPVSISADFFRDLGGHSLLAAKAVSLLRKDPQLQHISMRDLYENSTIEKLAQKFNSAPIMENAVNDHKQQSPKEDIKIINSRYRRCGFIQALGCGIQFALKSWEFLLVFLTLTFMIDKYSLFSMEFLEALFFLLAGLPPLLYAIAILSKWLILGRVKPGKYKLWGSYYIRWWFVQRISAMARPKHLVGSPLMNIYCRLMGAKIGKNCYLGTEFINTFDLLSIGDDTSINPGAMILGYIVEDGWLKIGVTTIGRHCLVGAKSVIGINTEMQDDAVLDDQSMLPANSRIPYKQYYFGSPARASETHSVNNFTPRTYSSPENFGWGLLHYLGLFFVETVYLFTYLPGIFFICYFYDQGHWLSAFLIAAPLGGLASVLTLWASVIMIKKLLLGKVKAGRYAIKSWFYIRKWTLERLFDRPEIAGLADTLFYPQLIRLMGAKIGKRVEMTDTPHIMPDFVNIGDESYTTGAAYLAVPRVYEGHITFAPVTIGKRAFVGNLAVMPCGSELGDGGLLGSLSIPPENGEAAKPNTAWFGSPAVLLPRRETFQGFSVQETYLPPKSLYLKRICIEFFRILPATFAFMTVIAQFIAVDLLFAHFALAMTILLFPLFDILITVAMTALTIAMKWLLMGKFRAAIKPAWSTYVWRSDLIDWLNSLFLDHTILDYVLGTPFIAIVLRALGIKIGKRVFINTKMFCEHDLTEIGDDVALNEECLIQTHLFEDRIFKMGPIKINSGCNVGCGSVVLYDAVMEEDASLGNLSLLMKGETLQANSHWQGIPAQAIGIAQIKPVLIPAVTETVSSLPLWDVVNPYRYQ